MQYYSEMSITVDPKPVKLARGTREFLKPKPGSAVVEHQMGMMWHLQLQIETLTRNIAVAGGLATALRLGGVLKVIP